MILKFLRSLFCAHEFKFVRNIYGDEIISWGYKRSIWCCSKCGKLDGRDDLHRLLPKEGRDVQPEQREASHACD